MSVGLIAPGVDLGHYPSDWHLHSKDERYLEWVLRLGGREIDEPRPGDFALFKFGHSFSHGAIVEQWPVGIHSLIRIGVIRENFKDNQAFAKRQVRFFTLVPEGQP